MERITLPRRLVNQMLQQAQSSPDTEVCGLIASKQGRPIRFIPVSNISEHPQRLFTMDPKQQIDAMRSMRERGEELFGIFHSHPHSPATPSDTDLEQAGYPEALYLIVSLTSEGVLEMRAYRFGEGHIREVRLDI